MLLFNPVWLFDIGFQLSFAAVTAILLLQPGLYGLLPVKNTALRKVWALITVSIAAQIGTAPSGHALFLTFFHAFSPDKLMGDSAGVVDCVCGCCIACLNSFSRLATFLCRDDRDVDSTAKYGAPLD